MSETSPLLLPARLGGAALSATVRAMGAVRGTAKPLHPRGQYVRATLTRSGSAAATGVGWLDEKGTDTAVVRLSGAVGLPPGWFDIQGLAIRLHDQDSTSDLLFASTGLGHLTRYLLTPSTSVEGRPYTTLLPYRSPSGPVLLALDPDSARSFRLLWAPVSGTWRRVGSLELGASYEGPPVSFDPILNPVPGLPPYPWVSALRRPSYRTARAQRGEEA